MFVIKFNKEFCWPSTRTRRGDNIGEHLRAVSPFLHRVLPLGTKRRVGRADEPAATLGAGFRNGYSTVPARSPASSPHASAPVPVSVPARGHARSCVRLCSIPRGCLLSWWRAEHRRPAFFVCGPIRLESTHLQTRNYSVGQPMPTCAAPKPFFTMPQDARPRSSVCR